MIKEMVFIKPSEMNKKDYLKRDEGFCFCFTANPLLLIRLWQHMKEGTEKDLLDLFFSLLVFFHVSVCGRKTNTLAAKGMNGFPPSSRNAI